MWPPPHAKRWRQGNFWLYLWELQPDHGQCWAFSIRQRKSGNACTGYANSQEAALERLNLLTKQLGA